MISFFYPEFVNSRKVTILLLKNLKSLKPNEILIRKTPQINWISSPEIVIFQFI